MQLRPEQLNSHLQQTLAPIYLVSGDVPVSVQETCDAIREAARAKGYVDRQVFYVETGFNWQELLQESKSLSLLGDKKLLELRIMNGQVGDAGSKALQAYVEQMPTDKILLISMGKIESSSQRTNWFQALLKAGVVLQIWPAENTRSDVFALSDAALQGDGKRVIQLLTGLQQEGIEPIIVLWALARELRGLATQAYAVNQGISIEKILQEQRVWEKRKPLIRAALQRHSLEVWRQLLQQASYIDGTIKGLSKGNVWDMLAQLSLAIAGKKLFTS